MLNRMQEDVRTIFAKDPAARTVWEILCCYPGLHAIWFHRLAHALWVRGFRFLARLVSHVSRALTGVEIRMVLTSPGHPMAGYLVEQVRRKVRRATDGKTVEVVLLDEAWRWEDREPHLRSGGGI